MRVVAVRGVVEGENSQLGLYGIGEEDQLSILGSRFSVVSSQFSVVSSQFSVVSFRDHAAR